MIQLPRFNLKEERRELVKLMCIPFRRRPDYLLTKANFTRFVNRLEDRNVLDCLAAMKG